MEEQAGKGIRVINNSRRKQLQKWVTSRAEGNSFRRKQEKETASEGNRRRKQLQKWVTSNKQSRG